MNEFFNFIISNFRSIELVNTISIVPTIDMDANKENIYPLVNIDLKNTSIQEQILISDFEITVVQQRNIKNKCIDNKLLTDSNYLDNLNETMFICQKFIKQIEHNTETLMAIDTITDLSPLKNSLKNGLDGFSFTLSLSKPNIVKAC